MVTKQDAYTDIIVNAKNVFKWWRDVPAPNRGELIRIFGNVLREELNKVGSLVTKESRKINKELVDKIRELKSQ